MQPDGMERESRGAQGGGIGDALILRRLFKPGRAATLASLFLPSGKRAGQQRLAEQLQPKGGIEVSWSGMHLENNNTFILDQALIHVECFGDECHC